MNARTKLLMKLNELSYKNPELRIGQIIVNSINREGFRCPEIFYLTDEELLDSLTDLGVQFDSIKDKLTS